MRAQLHAERPALERLLTRIEQGPRTEFERGLLARQLKHFGFIERTTFTLTDERELANRYMRATDAILATQPKNNSVSSLLADITRYLPLTISVIDGKTIEGCHLIEMRLAAITSSLTLSDRELISAILGRKTRSLLSAVAERARDAYTSIDAIAQQQQHSRTRVSTAVTAYGAALSRIESRLRGLEQTAAELPTAQSRDIDRASLLVTAPSLRGLDALEKDIARYGTVCRFRHIPYLALATDTRTANDLLSRTASLGHNATLYRERMYSVNPIPAQNISDDTWNILLVNAPRAWDITRGAGATVAVIDTGADYHHPEIQERFASERGANFVSHGEPFDDNGHGTHVSGTVAGKNVGVAPEATLYAVKVLDAAGYGSETAVLQGIEWAIDKGVHVINMSLGSSYSSSAERELVSIAAARGISIACAAGNNGDDGYDYPASYEGATSVAAINANKQRAPFSNYNDKVALAAPGVNIYSCVPGESYDAFSGTSMASPHVAGAYALLASRNTPERCNRLTTTAESLGMREEYGAGLIDCYAALGTDITRRKNNGWTSPNGWRSD